MKKRHLFLTALAAVAIMLCSCVSEMEISVEQVYSVGVFESEFTPNDSVLVLKYLQDKACPLSDNCRFKYAAARYGQTYTPPYETIVVYVGAFDYQRKK